MLCSLLLAQGATFVLTSRMAVNSLAMFCTMKRRRCTTTALVSRLSSLRLRGGTRISEAKHGEQYETDVRFVVELTMQAGQFSFVAQLLTDHGESLRDLINKDVGRNLVRQKPLCEMIVLSITLYGREKCTRKVFRSICRVVNAQQSSSSPASVFAVARVVRSTRPSSSSTVFHAYSD